MDKLRTNIRRVIYRIKKDYLTLNNAVLAVALVLCISWAWASVTTMTRNWELEQRLATRRLAREKLKLEIDMMELEQDYYQSAEYQELVARAKQNKMMEGETMVILPKNSAAALEKYSQVAHTEAAEASNFDSWMNLLFPNG